MDCIICTAMDACTATLRYDLSQRFFCAVSRCWCVVCLAFCDSFANFNTVMVSYNNVGLLIRRGWLWCFVHVECEDNADWMMHCTAMEVDGIRQRRHPKKTCWHVVEEDMKQFSLSQEGDQMWRRKMCHQCNSVSFANRSLNGVYVSNMIVSHFILWPTTMYSIDWWKP